mmetsp:Transcript_131770/g.357816  ORF Transcript_131770/g.357816 Transcript_131770/m.357816 type:complete len:270 (+) Transcript_131770:1-810(+)
MADITPALSAYRAFDEAGEASGQSNWTRSFDVITQTNNIHSGQYCSAAQKGTILYAYVPVADYVWSVDASSEDDDTVGIAFRVADTQNLYKYSHSNDEAGCRTLYKIQNGARSELWRASSYTSYTRGVKYAFQVRADGCRFVGHYQGVEDFDITDPDCVASGGVGVYSWANIAGRWNNMLLTTAVASVAAASAPGGQEPGLDPALVPALVALGAVLGACGASALWCLAARCRRTPDLARGKFLDDAGGLDSRGELPELCGKPASVPAAV